MFLVCAPIGATVGAISGSSEGVTAEQIEESKATAQREADALRLQETTLEAMLSYGKVGGIDLGRLPDAMGPAKRDDLPTYMGAKDVADTVIEVSVLSATVTGPIYRDVRVGLDILARVRVVNTHSGNQIDSFTVFAERDRQASKSWGGVHLNIIRSAYDHRVASIAENALDEILLVYHPKQIPKQPDTGKTERVPPYALRAIEPPIRTKFYRTGGENHGELERYGLNSLQPKFRWEPWPRGFDIFPGSGPGQAREVRYELRIFGLEGVAYERRGLVQPEHQIEQPLKPCRRYRWTVRARFNLDDSPRATEWTGAFDSKDGAVDPWSYRRGNNSPPGGVIWFYPIVETPGLSGEACFYGASW